MFSIEFVVLDIYCTVLFRKTLSRLDGLRLKERQHLEEIHEGDHSIHDQHCIGDVNISNTYFILLFTLLLYRERGREAHGPVPRSLMSLTFQQYM